MDTDPTEVESLRESLANLRHAAREVVDNWETGDLAGAVNWLASLLPDE